MYIGRVLEAFKASTLIYDLRGSGTSLDTKINRSTLIATTNHNPDTERQRDKLGKEILLPDLCRK
jgi:hypothetical protein